MSYNPSIPQSTDDPKDSQSQLLSNFTTLDSRWAINHVALTQSSNPGMHTKVFFNGVVADPGLATPQASLYIKTIAGASELFFQNGAAAVAKQLTGLSVVSNGSNTRHTLITPWNITIQMGSTSGTSGNFAQDFVDATPTIYTAVASGIDCNNVRISATGVTQTGFTYTSTGGTGAIRFFIVGWQ